MKETSEQSKSETEHGKALNLQLRVQPLELVVVSCGAATYMALRLTWLEGRNEGRIGTEKLQLVGCVSKGEALSAWKLSACIIHSTYS